MPTPAASPPAAPPVAGSRPDRVGDRARAGLGRLGAPGHLAGAAVLTIGTFLPWVHSGDRPLDVYDLRLAAHRLELLDDPWVVLPVAVVPLVLAASVLARWLGAHTPARLLSGVAAAYTVAGAWVVAGLDADLGSGPVVSATGALMIGTAMSMELLSRPGAGET